MSKENDEPRQLIEKGFAMVAAGQTATTVRAVLRSVEATAAEVLGLDDLSDVGAVSYAAGKLLVADGDSFESVAVTGDAALAANSVIFAEDIRQAVRELRRVVRPGGRVAVVDFAIDDQRRTLLRGTLFAVNMMSHGDTHTDPDIRAWMAAAGLVDVRRTDLDDARWVFTGRKT